MSELASPAFCGFTDEVGLVEPRVDKLVRDAKIVGGTTKTLASAQIFPGDQRGRSPERWPKPVQRQIEFGQPRRSEHDGLPALQERGPREGLRAALRFGFSPKKSGPDHAVPVIFPARAESER